MWVSEKKVQAIKAERVFFIEAGKIATAENRVELTSRSQPMVVAVHSSGGYQCSTTQSIHTQTDLKARPHRVDAYRTHEKRTENELCAVVRRHSLFVR